MKRFLKILAQNAVTIALVLGILVAVNILIGMKPLRLDLTDEKEYTLSPHTKKILGMLEDRLTFKLYYSKNLPPELLPIQQQVSDLLEELKAHTKQKIVIEHVEPDLNEEVEKETLANGIMPLEGQIQRKDKFEIIKAYMGMIIYYRAKKEVIPVLAKVQSLEYNLALSILKLAGAEDPKIGILLGGGEDQGGEYRAAIEIAKQLGTPVPISPDDTNLAQTGLKSLIIIQPTQIPPTFLELVDDLVSEGMNLLIFAGHSNIDNGLNITPVDTGLTPWLAKKGVAISDMLLLDTVQNERAAFQEGAFQFLINYPLWVKSLRPELNAENPITSRLEEVLFPWTNVIEKTEAQNSPWTVQVLAQSSPYSFLQEIETPTAGRQDIAEMVETPRLSQYPLAVVLENNDPKSGRIFLAANHHMLQDDFFNRSRSNFVFLQNAMEYFSWGEYVIGIRSRGKTSRPIEKKLGPEHVQRFKLAHVAGIPLLAVATGLAVLYMLKRRRNAQIRQLRSG